MSEERTVIGEDGQTRKWIDPRPELIDLFNQKYKSITGKLNPFPFGACMRAMLIFEITDEKTGELFIEYPVEEIWIEQMNGFFRDDFAREKRGFHFTYFLKQFGSFVRYNIKVRRKEFCGKCCKEHFSDEKCASAEPVGPKVVKEIVQKLTDQYKMNREGDNKHQID